MACEIELSRGFVTTVDDCDFEMLSRYRWSTAKRNGGFYAATKSNLGGRTAYMHRLLMGLDHGDKRRVDHKDGNGLNNRRENLRVCTHAENLRNQHRKQVTKSGFKGVWPSHNGKRKPWIAMFTKDYKRHYVGSFVTAEEAARAYDEAVKLAFGEFASLNFPEGQ
mgnify:CR=1 FL=1